MITIGRKGRSALVQYGVGAWLCGSFAVLGCASVEEPVQDAKHISPPPRAGAAAPEGRANLRQPRSFPAEPGDVAGPDESQAGAFRQLTPELREAFKLAGAISDTAGQRYQVATQAIKGNPTQLQALRAFYQALPATAYFPRQQVVQLLGLVGTADDVALLESIALQSIQLVRSSITSNSQALLERGRTLVRPLLARGPE